MRAADQKWSFIIPLVKNLSFADSGGIFVFHVIFHIPVILWWWSSLLSRLQYLYFKVWNIFCNEDNLLSNLLALFSKTDRIWWIWESTKTHTAHLLFLNLICIYSFSHTILINIPIQFSLDDFRSDFISIFTLFSFLFSNNSIGAMYVGCILNVSLNRRVYFKAHLNSQVLK